MTTCRIRFYDDDIRNIVNVHRSFPGVIECIHVPPVPLRDCKVQQQITTPTTPTTDANPLVRKNGYLTYIEECGGWELDGMDKDLHQVMKYLRNSAGGTVEDIVVQGLNYMDVQNIFEWSNDLPDVDTASGEIRGKLFLDWDQVVNHLEGVPIPQLLEHIAKLGLTSSGITKYCVGKRARYDAFRNLFVHLFDRNVHVYIVTNNGGCRNNDLSSPFQSLAMELHPRIGVVCCRKEYHGDKGFCIQVTGIAQLAFGRRHSMLSFGEFQRTYKKHKGKKALQKFIKAYNSLPLSKRM